ncbi:MAG TPA: MFS transporter [Steroidobacteraceae bacterium]|nr:MFS transporter [Steroidobacteraceae bacterium]
MRSLLAAFTAGPAAPPISDAGRVDALFRRHRLRVLAAITFGYALAYTCRLALSVVKKPLIDEGIFSPQDLGLIGSALFYSYAFGKLVNGFLADHANIKIFFATGVIASALINIGMGFSTVLGLSVALWALNGWFQGFGAPSGVVSLTAWFSNRERGRYYGVWSTAHSMGEGLTYYVVALFVVWFGWRAGFWVPGVICILAGLWIYAMMQDRPPTLGLPTVADWKNDHLAEAAPKEARVLTLQFSILRIPAIWVLAVSSATVYVTRYAIASWGILYLQEARGYELKPASILMAIGTIAGIAGCLLYGLTSDKLFAARRPPTNLLFAIAELAGLLLIFFGPQNVFVLTAGFILFGLGLNGLVTSLGGLFAVDIAPKKVAGAAMGFIGVFSYLGAAVQENISGALIESGMQVVGDVRTYDFGPAIAFWIGSSAVSMVLAATLWRVRLRE